MFQLVTAVLARLLALPATAAAAAGSPAEPRGVPFSMADLGWLALGAMGFVRARSSSKRSRATAAHRAAPRPRCPPSGRSPRPRWQDATDTSRTRSRRASPRRSGRSPRCGRSPGSPDPPELPPDSDSRLAHYLLDGRGWISLRVVVDLLAVRARRRRRRSSARTRPACRRPARPGSRLPVPARSCSALALRGMYRRGCGPDPRRRRAGRRRDLGRGDDSSSPRRRSFDGAERPSRRARRARLAVRAAATSAAAGPRSRSRSAAPARAAWSASRR